MAEHTPTPWVGFLDHGRLVAIMPAGREGDICTFEEIPSYEDGHFILRAVNSHDALLDAIRAYLETFDRCGGSESVSADEFAERRQCMRDLVGKVQVP